MTNARPSSDLTPIATKVNVDGRFRPAVYSPAGVAAKGIKPVPTEWGYEGGRPVYRRLPVAAGAYQMDYLSSNIEEAFVYIDPSKNQALGPGTTAVGRLDNAANVLAVQSGTLTWRYGQAEVEAYVVDISTLNQGEGLADGEYQIGYLLDYTIPSVDEKTLEGYDLYEVKDASLENAAVLINLDAYGIEHADHNLITADAGKSWQPNEFALAGDYFPGTSSTISFRTPVRVDSNCERQ